MRSLIGSLTAVGVLCLAASTVNADFSYPDFSSPGGINLVGSASIVSSSLRITPATWAQAGAAWYGTRQFVADGFTTSFQIQITAPGASGADGLVFLIQDDGPSVVAFNGRYMGYGDSQWAPGIRRSLAVEFDTYMNTEESFFDPNGNHLSVHTRGAAPNAAQETYSIGWTTSIPNLSDASVHYVTINYHDGQLDVYLDSESPRLSIPVDLAGLLALQDGHAYVGFTSSTGAEWENHDILAWTFAESGTPSPPFKIVSATWDRDHYQNGVDTAHLTVVTESNWGSGQVTLDANLVDLLGREYVVGSESFSLSPGASHPSMFSFALPAEETIEDYCHLLALTQNGQPVASGSHFAFRGTPLSEEQIAELIAHIEECNEVPPPLNITQKGISFIGGGGMTGVGLGGVGAYYSFKGSLCKAERYALAGDRCKQSVSTSMAALAAIGFAIAAPIGGGNIPLDQIPAVLNLTTKLLSGLGLVTAAAGRDNIESWLCDGGRPGGSRDLVIGSGEKVRAVLSDIDEIADSIGIPFAAHLVIEGPVRTRLDLPIGWATADSVSVDDVAPCVLAPDTLQWLTVGPTVSRYKAGYDTTVADADSLWPMSVSMRATGPGDAFVGVALRALGSGNTVVLYWPTVTLRDSTTMLVELQDHLGAYPLEIDYDGDGQIDESLYPEGASGANEPMSGPPGMDVRGLTNYPNPFRPPTTLTFEAGDGLKEEMVQICDVAGRLVRSIELGRVPSGRREIAWDGKSDTGSDLASGIYYYRVQYAGGVSAPKRAVLLR